MLRRRSSVHKLLESLGVLVDAGVDIARALEAIAENQSKDVVKLARRALKFQQGGGKNFSDALKPYLSAGEYALLRAGEESGNLPFMIQKIKRLRALKAKALSALVGAVAYPLFVLGMFFGMVYFVSSKAIGNIVQAFGEEVKNPFLSLILFLSNPLVILLFFLIVLSLVFTILFVMFKVNKPFRAWLDRFFPFNVYRFYQGTVFLYIYAMLIKSGYREEQSLELIRSLNGYYRLIFTEVLRRTRAGIPLGTALLQSGYVLPDVDTVNLLRTIQGYRGYEDTLLQAAEQNIDRALERINAAGKISNNIALSMVGLLIMAYVAGIMSMVYSVMQKVLTSGQGL